jgi:hypothetical protein
VGLGGASVVAVIVKTTLESVPVAVAVIFLAPGVDPRVREVAEGPGPPSPLFSIRLWVGEKVSPGELLLQSTEPGQMASVAGSGSQFTTKRPGTVLLIGAL